MVYFIDLVVLNKGRNIIPMSLHFKQAKLPRLSSKKNSAASATRVIGTPHLQRVSLAHLICNLCLWHTSSELVSLAHLICNSCHWHTSSATCVFGICHLRLVFRHMLYLSLVTLVSHIYNSFSQTHGISCL